MIKILKEGTLPKPKRYIYKTECQYCHCEFEFETEDCIALEKRVNGRLTVECPCCNNRLTCGRDNLEYKEVEESELL